MQGVGNKSSGLKRRAFGLAFLDGRAVMAYSAGFGG
jgi:hypothetical protein